MPEICSGSLLLSDSVDWNVPGTCHRIVIADAAGVDSVWEWSISNRTDALVIKTAAGQIVNMTAHAYNLLGDRKERIFGHMSVPAKA